jgi:hypothetical protein
MKFDRDCAEADADYYERRDARNHEHLVRHHQQAPSGRASARSRSATRTNTHAVMIAWPA